MRGQASMRCVLGLSAMFWGFLVAQQQVARALTPDFDFALSVEPPQPRVGDTVRLTFTVALTGGRGGIPAYRLSLDSSVLQGDAPGGVHGSTFPDTVTFERRAVSAGVANAQLHVNYETGVDHDDGSCCVWFFANAQSPAFEINVLDADDPTPDAPVRCDGDCDGNRLVHIDELTLSVGIALGRLSAGSCPALPEVVTIDTLVRAVHAALHGCPGSATPTSTPTTTPTPLAPLVATPTPTRTVQVTEPGVDLRPRSVGLARCQTGCLTVPYDTATVCVANHGEADAGEFLVQVNETRVLLDGLPSAVVRCFDLRIENMVLVIVDVDDRVAESREDNNEFSLPTPGPTECDAIAPPCTPTPTAGTVQSCDECCNDCTSEACFLACFGRRGCRLVTEWEGRITDDSTHEPIGGAQVSVNGTTVSTDKDGFYTAVSSRDEVCHPLDYLYEIAVSAPGYHSYLGHAYQSLTGGVRVQDVSLESDRAGLCPATGGAPDACNSQTNSPCADCCTSFGCSVTCTEAYINSCDKADLNDACAAAVNAEGCAAACCF